MSNRMDFTDPYVPKVYEDMVTSIVRSLQRFYEEMSDLCRAHSYKPMIDFTNAIWKFYNEDFRAYVITNFDHFQNGSRSIPALSDSVNAGASARITAQRYMDQLRDNLMDLFRCGLEPIRFEDATPQVESKDIEKMNEFIGRLLLDIAASRDEAAATAAARAENNIVYLLISPELRSTGESLENCLKSTINQVLDGAGLYRQGVFHILDQAATTLSAEDLRIRPWPGVYL